MMNEIFTGVAAVLLITLLIWGFRVLHREEWQFAASFPLKRLQDGTWEGINLTYYGIFNALAHLCAVIFLIALAGSVGVGIMDIMLIMTILLGICVPSSRLLARWIEKKSHTFTVGGAVFVGMLVAPFAVWAVHFTRHPDATVPFAPILAAMAIAYAIGEGVGRLACISFGCCYGKPLDHCHPRLQHIFHRFGVAYFGETKKIAYASGLEGRQVFPIQAVTSSLFTLSALAAAYLFLNGYYRMAFVLIMVITQLWRPLSEMLRADFRGGGAISVYQIMAFLAAGMSLIIGSCLPASVVSANISIGLQTLWQPFVILLLELWGAAIFLYTGRSRVTGAHMSFFVHKDRI